MMQERDQQVVKEFKRRWAVIQKANIGVGILAGIVYARYIHKNLDNIFQNNPIVLGMWAGTAVALTFIGSVFLVSWVFSFFILRCPACHKFGSMMVYPNFCSRCGASLR